MSRKLTRPDDSEYYVSPWSEGVYQGDIFVDAPLAIAAPPDAVFESEGNRRFLSGPFDSGPAILLSPSCAIAAQGPTVPAGRYAHPARIVAPIRPVDELLSGDVITADNVANLRADRLRNYLYLPEGEHGPEGAALLYMPVSVHHDVIEGTRVAQLTGEAYWHLRMKLIAFYSGLVVDPREAFGDPPAPQAREN